MSLFKKETTDAPEEKTIRIGTMELEYSLNQEVFVNIFCAVVYIMIYFLAEALAVRYFKGYEDWVTLSQCSDVLMHLICAVAVISALVLAALAAVENVMLNNWRDFFKLTFTAAAVGQVFMGVHIFTQRISTFWSSGKYAEYIVQTDSGYLSLLEATSLVKPTYGAYILFLLAFLVLFTNSKKDV